MNKRLAHLLSAVAERNGLRLRFHQEPDGLWVALWAVGVQPRQAWAGTLVEMWYVAQGYKF